MAYSISKLKRGISKLLTGKKKVVKASVGEKKKVTKQLKAKYPQMYKSDDSPGTKSIMDRVRKMDPSSVSGVGKSRTRVLKKKYGGK